MNRGNKVLGVFIIVSFICTATVFVIEERNYSPCHMQFEVTETNTEKAVNLNTATKEELMTLDGVGEKMADRIIEFRETSRHFETIQDIKLVKGFGDILFGNNKHVLTVK